LDLEALSRVSKEERHVKPIATECKRKKACKIVKKRRSCVKMVLSEGLTVEHALEYSGKALIGKLHGQHILDHNVNGWMQKVLVHVLGYESVIHVMAREWISSFRG
jgi:hypothetical protein